MNTSSPDPISACRHCRYYTTEGRRGGQCDQLDTLVHGDWKACPLALPAFAPSWESVETHTMCSRPVPESLEQNAKPDAGAPPVLVAVGGGKGSKHTMMSLVTDAPPVAIS